MPAIDARFDRMIEHGAIDEVRALLALGLDRRASRRCVRTACASLRAYLGGTSSLEDAVAKAKTETAATPSGR